MALNYSGALNTIISTMQPWNLLKSNNYNDLIDFFAIMYNYINVFSHLINPYMPTLANKIKNDFKINEKSLLLQTKEPTIYYNKIIKLIE